ncbi:hypothetical protein V1511DRAFT_503553 [Dipodascopsis uninucleata]
MSAATAIISPSPFKPGRDYNHSDDREYKRLRDLANTEFKARSRYYDEAHAAYERGDGAEAKRLSEKAKEHAKKMDDYNAQAAVYVFRANNADSDGDEIDLHGLYVKEAEEYLTQRIAACKQRNESHLEVIVGKGNHSNGGVAKIKPAVEQLCKEHGFAYSLDGDNSGVIIIDFTKQGGYIPMSSMGHKPKHNFAQNGYHYPSPQRPQATYQPQYPGYSQAAQPQYVGHPQQHFQVENQQQQNQSPTDIFMFLFKCLKQCF